jgi:hypothetical protein
MYGRMQPWCHDRVALTVCAVLLLLSALSTGYASEGASRCAPGFYALKGSRRPCQSCGPCRTTLDNPAFQRLISDCIVQPGCGVADSSANLTDAFNPDTTGLDDTALAQLPTLECPMGYYGPGNATGAKCVACPDGSTTQQPGKTAVTDCNGKHVHQAGAPSCHCLVDSAMGAQQSFRM